jgi:DNA-nicking Smr family endonuclease
VTDGPPEEDAPPDVVTLPPGEELDLHSFAPRDVVSVVEEYLRVCREGGIRRVRLVHGRGKGVQRAEVRRLLAGLAGVLAFEEAPPALGGWGATLVDLAPLAPPDGPEKS